MDEGLVTELESAIADSGALVVRAQKYRRGAGPEGAALLGAALALGDEARRLHRRDALDAAAAAPLLAEARALAERLQALLAEVRAGVDYRAAVVAHRAGDRATLVRLLPAIFAGLEPAPAPGDLSYMIERYTPNEALLARADALVERRVGGLGRRRAARRVEGA